MQVSVFNKQMFLPWSSRTDEATSSVLHSGNDKKRGLSVLLVRSFYRGSCRVKNIHIGKTHYALHASVIVLVSMLARFLMFANAAQRTMHSGQSRVFKDTKQLQLAVSHKLFSYVR